MAARFAFPLFTGCNFTANSAGGGGGASPAAGGAVLLFLCKAGGGGYQGANTAVPTFVSGVDSWSCPFGFSADWEDGGGLKLDTSGLICCRVGLTVRLDGRALARRSRLRFRSISPVGCV